MFFALLSLYVFTSQLDQVLVARGDLTAEPFAGMRTRAGGLVTPPTLAGKVVAFWDNAMMWTREKLELWTAPHDDKRIAWTLGIGWACCGGGLAGACLVFAKAACVASSLLAIRPADILSIICEQRSTHFRCSIA